MVLASFHTHTIHLFASACITQPTSNNQLSGQCIIFNSCPSLSGYEVNCVADWGRGGERVIGAVVCLHAVPRVQLFSRASSEQPLRVPLVRAICCQRFLASVVRWKHRCSKLSNFTILSSIWHKCARRLTNTRWHTQQYRTAIDHH